MKRKLPGIVVVLAASLLCSGLTQAQTPPIPAADTAFAAQKSAFLALPLTMRKAAQDALVWLGVYNGANDGDFGKRTRDAIVAWQRSVKATPDGVLGPTLLQALISAAEKARTAVGFQVVSDPKTGARIGAPTKLHGQAWRPEARLRLERGCGSRPALRAALGRDADPQGRLQGDEARELLRRLGAGRRDEVLFAVRDKPGREPAGPRLHFQLSRRSRSATRPGGARGRQFV